VGTSPIWDSTATANPYAGYAFVGSGTRDSGGSSRDTLRENFRATLTGELRASDFLDKNSLLARILGRHVFTALYDLSTTTTRNLTWARYALGTDYTDAVGLSSYYKLTDGTRVLDWITYLGDVSGATSASGLNLSNITGSQSPSGAVTVKYWNPTYTSTADPTAKDWTNTYASYSWSGSVWNGTWNSSSAAANYGNPSNYAGWTNGTFTILNADEGDRDLLYTSASKLRTKIESKAITYQGYLWDDTIVPTWGFRRDKVTNDSGYGTTDTTTGSVLDFDSIEYNPNYTDVAYANSISWGGWRTCRRLSAETAVGYGHQSPLQPRQQYALRDSLRLRRHPPAQRHRQDRGVWVHRLHASRQAAVQDDLVRDHGAERQHGLDHRPEWHARQQHLLPLSAPAWGTAHALIARAGLAGELSTYDSAGNWVAGGNSAQGTWDWAGCSSSNSSFTSNMWWPGNDPLSAAYKADPVVQSEAAAISDWFKYMNMGQDWYDAYGFSIDATAWNNSDWSNIIDGFNTASSSIGYLQAAGSGRIRGTYPVGTCDTRSTGVEMELTAQPFKGLSVSLNASRTYASQTRISPEFVAAITDLYERLVLTNAGDMRLWWAGDTETIGQRFLTNIWAPYQFQVLTNGKMVSEMSPWRFNAIANYTFDETLFNGKLKNVNVGGGYRGRRLRSSAT
jgi:hypothetical protein